VILFELDWLGGVAERHFRAVRPGTDDLPWGTLAPEELPPLIRDRLRLMWTKMARNEYATAIHMSQLLQLLLVARTPVDLVGMASDFVADEMRHVELCARIAMEIGGGAPATIDLEAIALGFAPELTPRQRATEAILRVCCIGETLSVPMLAEPMKAASHPLARGALQHIVREEAQHGRLGWLYLDWLAPELDDAERLRLGMIATQQLEVYAPLWRLPDDDVTCAPWLATLRTIGWVEASHCRETAQRAAIDDVITPLIQRGIPVAAQLPT
jgi:hypothetical protein